MTLEHTPVRLNLKKDDKLEVEWQDGLKSSYSVALLRAKCPCALCRSIREENDAKKPLLRVLPGNYAQPVTVIEAELVGNYGLRLEWSDNHGTGIYSFQYLREISPQRK